MPDTFYKRKARSTGTEIVLEDTTRENATYSVNGARFVAACLAHDIVVPIEAEKWSQAYAASADPRQWCPECAKMPERTAEPKPTKSGGGKSVQDQTLEERQAAAEHARKVQAERRAAEAAERAKEARAELKEMPRRLREAQRAYEKAGVVEARAFRKADAARPGTDRAQALTQEWLKAQKAHESAYATLRNMTARKRQLEEAAGV